MKAEDVPMPVAEPRRRFTVLDGMILVAATAPGFASAGRVSALVRTEGGLIRAFSSTVEAGLYSVAGLLVLVLVLPFVAGWTLALVPLGLIRPRPPLRRLARQPGWIASCAFGLALGFVVAIGMGLTMASGASGLLANLAEPELAPALAAFAGPAILASWMSPALGRRCRPVPNWIDRLGRGLGVFWLVMSVAGPALVLWAIAMS